MDSEQKKILGAKFKTAGSSGKKLHVMPREGKWVLFKEGSERILSQYTDKRSAVLNGKKILSSNNVKALVIHKTDGTVDKFQLAK